MYKIICGDSSNEGFKKERLGSRFYCINNMYLSSIHAGIQSAHSVVELINKYLNSDNDLSNVNSSLRKQVSDCANFDKTIVILNGGHQSNLISLVDDLKTLENESCVAFAPFYESEESLNGCLTNIALVATEAHYHYNIKEFIRYVQAGNAPFNLDSLFSDRLSYKEIYCSYLSCVNFPIDLPNVEQDFLNYVLLPTFNNSVVEFICVRKNDLKLVSLLMQYKLMS